MISKKRKISDGRRAFNDEWFEKYFVVQQNEKTVCLICQSIIACLKEYNIKRHYNSIHAKKYGGILGQLRIDKG